MLPFGVAPATADLIAYEIIVLFVVGMVNDCGLLLVVMSAGSSPSSSRCLSLMGHIALLLWLIKQCKTNCDFASCLQLAWMQRQVAQLQQQEKELEEQLDAAVADVQDFRNKRQEATYDVTLNMRLKQGQVRMPQYQCELAGIQRQAVVPSALLVAITLSISQ